MEILFTLPVMVKHDLGERVDLYTRRQDWPLPAVPALGDTVEIKLTPPVQAEGEEWRTKVSVLAVTWFADGGDGCTISLEPMLASEGATLGDGWVLFVEDFKPPEG